MRIDGLQERPLDQEGLAVKLAPRIFPFERVGGVQNPQFEQLARVVPLVDRVSDIESLVALQPDQIGLEHRCHRRCEGGFADAGLALQKERALQPQREKQRHRQATVGHVMLGVEALLEIGDGLGRRGDEKS